MEVKEVYSIRINKDDEEIKKYLKQFPSSKQNKALKSLLKYGVSRLQEDYAKDQYIKKLQETINHIQVTQEEKLEEIKKLITNLQKSKFNEQNNSQSVNVDEDDDSFDLDKAKKAMEEALSMFTG